MKISEMIAELESVRGRHGDVEVLSDSADGCVPVVIGEVQECVDDDGVETMALMLFNIETVRE